MQQRKPNTPSPTKKLLNQSPDKNKRVTEICNSLRQKGHDIKYFNVSKLYQYNIEILNFLYHQFSDAKDLDAPTKKKIDELIRAPEELKNRLNKLSQEKSHFLLNLFFQCDWSLEKLLALSKQDKRFLFNRFKRTEEIKERNLTLEKILEEFHTQQTLVTEYSESPRTHLKQTCFLPASKENQSLILTIPDEEETTAPHSIEIQSDSALKPKSESEKKNTLLPSMTYDEQDDSAKKTDKASSLNEKTQAFIQQLINQASLAERGPLQKTLETFFEENIPLTTKNLKRLFNILNQQREHNQDLNFHRHLTQDNFFGIKNTRSWRNVSYALRRHAETVLFEEVDQLSTAEEKIQKLNAALRDKDGTKNPLFTHLTQRCHPEARFLR